ncbi:MAG: cytochrome c [Candidatus Tectomicrobia bacterium]|nr:cytochrome c [Candidatus Tectomicrobia bacterium]
MLKRFPCFSALVLVCLVLWPLAAQAQDAAAGKEIYEQYCALCHGPQGKGDGSLSANLDPKPRNHTDGAYMNTLADAHLLKVVGEGGAAAGLSPIMPAWKDILSAQQIQDVVAFVRTLAVPPYTPAADQ